MLSPETVLQNRYRVVHQLGQGGMGAVYEAVDERLDTIVALKETLFTDEKLRKQFEREARLLARMHHPALPRVSDHFNEGEGQFLVMQYIAGEDLAAMLAARNAPFPEDEVLRWADQLCDALDYLHTQEPQIIHRDIKPQNLKLTARGQIVLLDFGLAKGSAGQLTAVTTSASIFGYTPNYAPLEQVQGLGTDARSDIYALAATLFHLITNVKPPDALSRAAALVNGQPDPLPAANTIADVNEAVANVLTKGMSQKRDDRFPSAKEMREALHMAAEYARADAETATTKGAAAFAATNIGSEQATRLVGGQTQSAARTSPISSEAQTLVAGEGTNVNAAGADIATLVRPQSRANSRLWLGSAIVLILIAGAAGAFYAYRVRVKSQQTVAQPAQNPSQTDQGSQTVSSPSPVTTQAAQVKTTEAKTEKTEKSEKTKNAATAQRVTAPKSEAPKNVEAQEPVIPKPFEPGHDPNRDANRARDPNSFPRQSDFDPFRGNQGKQPGHPPATPDVKVLPNGGRLIKQPDGTVIFVGPKGQTRVIPPGQQPNRRRRTPVQP
jgi:hypothetical protein